jgi:hypothetical protein
MVGVGRGETLVRIYVGGSRSLCGGFYVKRGSERFAIESGDPPNEARASHRRRPIRVLFVHQDAEVVHNCQPHLFVRDHVGQVLQHRGAAMEKTPDIDSPCGHAGCKGKTS